MLRAAIIALALMAAPAFADPPEEELTAAPGSIATGMIEGAEADGVFELVHNGQVSVRHVGSGMRCDFARDGAGGSLTLFRGLPRGDDVACDFDYPNYKLTLYASRYPDAPPLNELLAGAVQSLRQIYPDASPVETAYYMSVENAPANVAARFLLTRNGARHYSSVHVAQIGAWTIKQRYSAPARTQAAINQAEISASMMFQLMLIDLAAETAAMP